MHRDKIKLKTCEQSNLVAIYIKKLKLPNLFLEVEEPKSSQFNHSFHSQVIWNTPWQSLQLLYTLHNTCLDSEKGVYQEKAPVDQKLDCAVCPINQLILKHYCQCFTGTHLFSLSFRIVTGSSPTGLATGASLGLLGI